MMSTPAPHIADPAVGQSLGDPKRARLLFMSYRRQDSEAMAGRLFDDLSDRFGEATVFRDVRSIEPGQDFRIALDRALSLTRVMLVVIGPRWLTVAGADGRRRLDDPDDLVCAEVRSALNRGLPVIPVLVDGANLPERSALPEGLQSLVSRQVFRMEDRTWQHDVRDLEVTLRKLGIRHARSLSARRWVAGICAVALLATLCWGFLHWRTRELPSAPPQTAATHAGPELTAEELERKNAALRNSNAGDRTEEAGSRFWTTGSTINVAFLDGDESLRKQFKDAAAEWAAVAHIRFAYVNPADSEIRVSFSENDGSWSYVGTDALGILPSEKTINLGLQRATKDPDERHRIALHEIGHALGLIHEYQAPNADLEWDWEKVDAEMTGAPNYWSKETVRANFDKDRSYGPLYAEKPFDPDSVMMMELSPSWLKKPVVIHHLTHLSPGDIAFIKKAYP